MAAQRRHFAFFTFPRFGHVRPTLATVRLLVERGHRVSYVVADSYADAVAAAGATPLPYPSGFPAVVPLMRTADDLAEIFEAYLHEELAGLSTAWPAFADDAPDLVVEDALSSGTSRLVADRAGCSVVRVFAGLAGNDEVPLNGAEPDPGDPVLDPGHPVFARLGEDMAALLLAQGIDPEHGQRITATVVPAANLVYVPRSFQPRSECFDESFVFVGPGEPPPARGQWRPPPGRRVALVSLGTCAPSNPRFFRDCAEAFAGTDWHLVMTTGGHLEPEQVRELPGSVELHTFLDHNLVLPHADVQVCQAGAGSLMDAFSRGIPVVAVPQQPDSRVVARHVEALGLGRALLAEDVTGAAVRAAVDEVTGTAGTRDRVAAMAADIRAAGGATRAVEVLDELSARRPATAPDTAAPRPTARGQQ